MPTLLLQRRLATESDTRALGAALAAHLQAGDFIELVGDLGAGKTTLARGIIQAFMGSHVDVPSPTFTFVQIYSRTKPDSAAEADTSEPLDLFHFDLYRLKNSEEVWELGWEDIQAGIALVEWPDRAGAYRPHTRLEITLSFEGTGSFEDTGRVARLFAHNIEYWKDRLDGV